MIYSYTNCRCKGTFIYPDYSSVQLFYLGDKKVCLSITNAGECPSLTPFLRRLKGHPQTMKKSMDDFFVNLLGYFTDVNQVLTSQKCFHLNYDLFKNLIFDQFRRKIQAKFLKKQELALSLKTMLKLSWLRKQT